MPDELDQHSLELAPVKDQKTVEALPADGPYEPLGERLRAGRPQGCVKDPNAFGAEHLVDAGGELGVSIPDQEPGRAGPLGEGEAQVAGLLHYPLPHRRGRYAAQVHPKGQSIR
jgi:hypothetical protein